MWNLGSQMKEMQVFRLWMNLWQWIKITEWNRYFDFDSHMYLTPLTLEYAPIPHYTNPLVENNVFIDIHCFRQMSIFIVLINITVVRPRLDQSGEERKCTVFPSILDSKWQRSGIEWSHTSPFLSALMDSRKRSVGRQNGRQGDVLIYNIFFRTSNTVVAKR